MTRPVTHPPRALPADIVAALRVSEFLTALTLGRAAVNEHARMQAALRELPAVSPAPAFVPAFAPVAELAGRVSAAPTDADAAALQARLLDWCRGAGSDGTENRQKTAASGAQTPEPSADADGADARRWWDR